jgi:deoxyribodipyrimidine photo-lyase
MSRSLAIAWFRQDLRIHDNPALAAAAEHDALLPIYILDDENAGDWAMGGASRTWLHQSLAALNRSLGGRLQLFRGDAHALIHRLIDEYDIDAVYWNRCYEPWRVQRDTQIRQDLIDAGITTHSYNASLLWEPWEIAKQDGTPYRVFTPFYQKGCLRAPPPRQPQPAPVDPRWYSDVIEFAQPLDSLGLLPADLDWHEAVSADWRIGEDAANDRLEQFCEDRLQDYRRARDFPAIDATSRISPHLHFGEISPHQLWQRIEHLASRGDTDGATHFLRELGWREFSFHLLYHFPGLPEDNFNARFDRFEWRADPAALALWQRGQTGFPIVDAGMRELWQTGYMHNRVRMIVASFLIKNLLIHWRNGADWFWDCLFDADLANNSASWQWCAGSGADAAPYFRIFNPVLQSEKFDPDGEYLLRYCPELGGLPARLRHKPWEASLAQLGAAGIRLGVDYPQPMVDLKVTRERALARYKDLTRGID